MTKWRATILAAMVMCPLLPACSMIEVGEQPASVTVVGRMLWRAYRTDVPLVADGRASCAIVCPAEPGPWRSLADELAAAIRGLGADDVPIVLDTEAVPKRLGPLRSDLQSKSLILLGDLNTNRAFFPFYASYYTCADARYPGGAGYELRTVVRPFGRENSCLLVGASTKEGFTSGVNRLIERLKALRGGWNVRLPYLLEVRLGEELAGLLAPAMAELETGAGAETDELNCGEALGEFTRNAHLYFYTGDERFARRARAGALRAAECDQDTPGYGVGDYSMENLAAAWRRVSCSPAFSAADRAAIDMAMYKTAAVQSKAWWRIGPEQGIGNRHQTTGGLAWWTLLRVLGELSAPDEEARAQLEKWYKEAEAYCDGLLRHYWDDEDDYQCPDSAQNAASYAMQADRMEWFAGGLARRAAERLVMTVDNLGWYAGMGGYGDALPGWERFPQDAGMLMGACGFIYEDGGYLWVLDRFETLDDSWGSLQPWGLHQFDTGGRIQPRRPGWVAGLQVARFTPYRLDRINSGEFLRTSIMDNFRPAGLFARPVAAKLAYDKLAWRSGTEEDGLYFLLQGSAGGTLTTIDMNAIIRLTDAGKLWLVHNTGRRSLYFKNGVYVSNGTNQQPMAPSCELTGYRDFGRAAIAVSRLPDCRGMTWTRNLLVLRDGFVAAIDHLRATEAGDYSLSCGWRTPGFASMKDGRWEAMQDEARFSIVPASLDGVDSERPPERDGATRPTTLRENRSLKALPGDVVVFENVLYTAAPGQPREFEVRRAAPGVVVIRDAGDGSLYLAAASDRGVDAAGVQSDASAVLIAGQEIYLVGGKQIGLGSASWTTDSGRVALKPEEAAGIQTSLRELWSAAAGLEAKPDNSAEKKDGPTVSRGPEPTWQHGGPGTRGGLVDGVRFVKGRNVSGLSLLATDWIMPLLRAEPRLMGRQGSELLPKDRESRPSEDTPAGEPVLWPLKDAEFVLELPGEVRVGEIDFFGDTFGQTSEAVPPATLSVELTFSSDGFQADRRNRRLDLPRRETFHNLYKGHCYLFECYWAAGLDEAASAVRVRVLDGPGDRLVITDVQVRSAGEPMRAAVEARPMDLDGDGDEEVVSWTGDGDLVVFDSDGSEVWRRRFEQGILAVDAWDLDGDGRREVFVSRRDRQVEVLNGDGTPRWSKDYREMKRETGGKYFGDGSAVYGMAVWRPKIAPEPVVLLTSYWFSTRLDAQGKVQDVFRRAGHFAQIREMPAGLPGGGGLAIRSEVPWSGNVPLQWWDVDTGEPSAENAVPNGRSVYFELADYDGDGEVEALTASEQGIGLYSPRGPRTCWEQMTDAPPVGVGVLPGAGGEAGRIVYGRQDGYVFVLSAAGEVLASAVLGEPLQCLTVAPGSEPTVWVGTRSELIGLRPTDLSAVWRRVGAYQKLMIQRVNGRQRVLGITVGGVLEAFDPG